MNVLDWSWSLPRQMKTPLLSDKVNEIYHGMLALRPVHLVLLPSLTTEEKSSPKPKKNPAPSTEEIPSLSLGTNPTFRAPPPKGSKNDPR